MGLRRPTVLDCWMGFEFSPIELRTSSKSSPGLKDVFRVQPRFRDEWSPVRN